MDTSGRNKATRNIRAMRTLTHPVRWELYLLAGLALLGVLSHPAPRG